MTISTVVMQLKKERERAAKQVAKLEAAIAALGNLESNSTGQKRRTLSLAARKKIAAAQRKRWAKVKKAV